MVDLVPLIRGLRPPHHHHHLAAEAAHLQWEQAKNREEWGRAAESLRAEIACREAQVSQGTHCLLSCLHI